MSMVVRTNTMALNALRNMNTNNKQVSNSLQKLSSGYKINSAADDASGLAISEKMKSQISGLDQAASNAQDGISLVQTAEGATTQIHSMLNRMVTLATKSANGTIQNDVDRTAIQSEVDSLNTEITRIATSTKFNGINLLDGSLSKASGSTIASDVTTDLSYTTTAAKQSSAVAKITAGSDPLAQGEKVSYTLALNDGTSTTISLTNKIKDGTNYLEDQSGNTYSLTDGTKGAVTSDITKALQSAFSSAVGGNFSITADTTAGVTDNTLTFTAKNAGTAAAAVTSLTQTNENGAVADTTNLKLTAGTKAVTASAGPTAFAAATDNNVYTLKMSDGTTHTIQIQVAGAAAAGALTYSIDGGTAQTSALNAVAGVATNKKVGDVLTTALNSIVGDSYTVADDAAGALTITAKAGAYGGTISSLTESYNGGGASDMLSGAGASNNTAVTSGLTAATDATVDINGQNITAYDGTNAKDATFTINGKQFVIADKTTDVSGLDSNVTVLTGDKTQTAEYFNAQSAANATYNTLANISKVNSYSLIDNALNSVSNKATLASKTGITVNYDSYDMADMTVSDKQATPNTNLMSAADPTTGLTATDTWTIALNNTVSKTDGMMTLSSVTPDASGKGLKLQIGDSGDTSNTATVTIDNLTAAGIGTKGLDVSSQSAASAAIKTINTAINQVSTNRANLGALQNRLDYTIDNLNNTSENITSANSAIRDTDMASEMMKYTQSNTLQQAAQAMLAQAKSAPQSVLQLLQG